MKNTCLKFDFDLYFDLMTFSVLTHLNISVYKFFLMNGRFLNISLSGKSIILDLKRDKKAAVFVFVTFIASLSFSCQTHWFPSFILISSYFFGFLMNSRPFHSYRVLLYLFCLLLSQLDLDHFLPVLILRQYLVLTRTFIHMCWISEQISPLKSQKQLTVSCLHEYCFLYHKKNSSHSSCS